VLNETKLHCTVVYCGYVQQLLSLSLFCDVSEANLWRHAEKKAAGCMVPMEEEVEEEGKGGGEG
jgi:hypothetical protein